MRPGVVLLVLLATTVASCATRPGAFADGTRHASRSDQSPMSSTEIGPENPLLAKGAQALEVGRVVEGVRLTLEGLKHPSPTHDLAAGHANLCAGYVLLGRYGEALSECNLSIQLNPNNWRAYNNRAAAFSAQGLYELAVEDIEAGLKIAPDSAVLLKSLAIIHRDQQLLRKQQGHFASDA